MSLLYFQVLPPWRLRFEKGRCTQINGKAVTPLQAVQQCNLIAGRNGIGLCQASDAQTGATPGCPVGT